MIRQGKSRIVRLAGPWLSKYRAPVTGHTEGPYLVSCKKVLQENVGMYYDRNDSKEPLTAGYRVLTLCIS